MNTADHLHNYLHELRDEVCGRCAEQRSDEPLPDGAETPCGWRLPLAQLIDALSVCDGQGCGREEYCPCTADKLVELALGASAEMERRHVLRERFVETLGD